jgi:hypothetical protein
MHQVKINKYHGLRVCRKTGRQFCELRGAKLSKLKPGTDFPPTIIQLEKSALRTGGQGER